MTAQSLIFRTRGADHRIRLTDEHAPKTLKAVLDCLPQTADIHCAKIAGCHIMWPAPFVERVEKGADVMSMPPGAFFYWPERQYLEITYDRVQAESAQINYLGRLEGDVDWLREFADQNRRKQGQKIFWAELFVEGEQKNGSPPPPPPPRDSWSYLHSARLSVWSGEPDDVQRLLDKRGLMIPYGPLSMAEGEMRKLHELLWRLWNDETRYTVAEKKTIAAFAVEAAITRVAGFCHMQDVGEVLGAGMACLADSDLNLSSVLKELVLYCGRIAAWLDLRICWWPMNEITLKATTSWVQDRP